MFRNFRFIIDALYGPFKLDPFLIELICQPEIQRLREVRLSNINSLLLPGSSNISRFEHSVGTAHLADLAATEMSLPNSDRLNLVCAALLHDVTITPFGHLMEEAFHYAGLPFDHETRLQQIFGEGVELGNIDFQIFQGKTVGFRRVLDKRDYKKAGATIPSVLAIKNGEGILGRLIQGSIDLDNVDNVCRMAYHIGLPFRRELPISLIKSFFIYKGSVSFDAKKSDFILEWLNLRETLYNILMTNPVDFVAKSMLIEAIRLGLTGSDGFSPVLDTRDWKLTDSELIHRLAHYKPTELLIRKLRTGDLFDLIGFFWIDKSSFFKKGLDSHSSVLEIRSVIADALRCSREDILIYMIKDKRTRAINGISFRDRVKPETIIDERIGAESNRLLIGICVGKETLATTTAQHMCQDLLRNITDDGSITLCKPEEHIPVTHAPKKSDGQLSIFTTSRTKR